MNNVKINSDYIEKQNGKTFIYIVGREKDSSKFMLDSHSYLMKMGDIVENDNIENIDTCLSIDDFLEENFEDVINSNFPNYLSDMFSEEEFEKYISIPYKTIITVDVFDYILLDSETNNYYKFAEDNLTYNYIQLYETLKELSPNLEFDIITLVSKIN